MNIYYIDRLKNLFSYKPTNKYSFTISQNNENPENNFPSSQKEKNSKIYTSVSVNQEYLKVKYNTLVNSDIIIREFNLIARGKEYKAFLIYIDGMINSTMINDFVLKPLMLKNKSNMYAEDDSISIAVSR